MQSSVCCCDIAALNSKARAYIDKQQWMCVWQKCVAVLCVACAEDGAYMILYRSGELWPVACHSVTECL
jgi:hypothetical protein